MNGTSDTQFLQDAYIQDGASPAAGVIVVGCTVGDDYDDPKSRVGVRTNGAWLEFGFSGDAVVSLDASSDGRAYALGENGNVLRFDWKTPRTRDELRSAVDATTESDVGAYTASCNASFRARHPPVHAPLGACTS
jgi:hypothetical protein